MNMLFVFKHRFKVGVDVCEMCGATAQDIEDGKASKNCTGPEDPVGCQSCGLIAGCCQNYPECPGNPEWKEGT